ncbi:hypothetical protein SNEBB_004908 [Seison nebaliae]|nr:hypothetical protein SNEBB_004908 [Seison nebaliae]
MENNGKEELNRQDMRKSRSIHLLVYLGVVIVFFIFIFIVLKMFHFGNGKNLENKNFKYCNNDCSSDQICFSFHNKDCVGEKCLYLYRCVHEYKTYEECKDICQSLCIEYENKFYCNQ